MKWALEKRDFYKSRSSTRMATFSLQNSRVRLWSQESSLTFPSGSVMTSKERFFAASTTRLSTQS